MTRAAAKRKASSMALDENPVSKKRVVLGELPNMSNVVAVPNQERETLKAKTSVNTSKRQMKKALMIPEASVLIESRSVDPQMCEPFASDICAYLREMEVKKKSSLVDFLIPSFLILVILWYQFMLFWNWYSVGLDID